MELTTRQQETILHLNYNRKLSGSEIISYCTSKILQTRHSSGGKRRHSKKYYLQIISWINNGYYK